MCKKLYLLVGSQEGQPETSQSAREIARQTEVSHSSVWHIINMDLNLKTCQKFQVNFGALSLSSYLK